ncbi:hypothetical protein BT96DRAFT_1006532 [Gymnopus androsaceus JB14]|uniref:Uncharacterized protein n=1 Tax=Gymnopus androsaceus JB14 TaxID=1447944 RepID=A0A6A4GKX9_9AGAR|nr:hypothetical protein BT96DRAFT_1006532 [Gymnopus androsaceus JB14]
MAMMLEDRVSGRIRGSPSSPPSSYSLTVNQQHLRLPLRMTIELLSRFTRLRVSVFAKLASFCVGSVTRNNSDGLLNRVKNLPGYTTPVFTGKEEQRALVQQEVAAKVLLGLDLILIKINHGLKGFIPQELVANEVNWFYTNLGIDDTYFRDESQAVICDHIIALFGAKVLAYTKHDPSKLVIDLEKIDENGNGATFIHTSPPGITTTEGPGAACESRIDTLFLDNSMPTDSRLSIPPVNKCVFPDTPATKDAEGRTVSDKSFLEKASEKSAEQRYGPVMEVFEGSGSRGLSDTRWAELPPSSVLSPTSTTFTLSMLLANTWNSSLHRKKLRCNGITIISLYLNPVPNSNAPAIEHSIFQVMKETLPFCLPKNPFFLPKAPGTHAVQEATYTYCGWVFAQHFCNRLGPAYLQLKNILDENDPAHAEVLNNIKRRFREEMFTRESIEQVIHTHSELIRLLYVNFAMVHYPASDHATELMLTLSYQRLQTIQPLSDEELYDKIRRTVPNKHSLQVLESFLIFNKHILKTNFYQPTKVALSFRLDPGFLPEVEYPKKPFAMFFVIGNEFRGFHIRFRDVARGGIRIVMSRNKEMYLINQRMLFDENYNLASTQSLKNKDIPEGGAKGNRRPANPRKTPGIKETLVDLYEKPELLFFGPDEGTADMMDWAALHARDRGAETWWKSFTTGKSAETLGGVPHDTYGMTSLSIRHQVSTAHKLPVSQSTVSRLKAWVLATGTVAKDCKGNCGRPRKLNALDLACLESCIERTPDLFLKELQEQLFEARGVEASQWCIHTSLKRRGFTRKEVSIVHDFLGTIMKDI